eukprot:CAMPEP_0170173780 /NCGR_PEP_ID=MMETSP0040_2-20121228/7050_1 /TAXON_ID=641309 /ORGANISM="Lotharella oceanica, Strain CCMP622" /LENGTH=275 /DNA_ID=CAMNT_0010415125 /DNA_START=150 /DNA_END=977 /DNA_ORIENTATION=+
MGKCCGTAEYYNHEEQEKETHLRFLKAVGAAKQGEWTFRMKAKRYVPSETLARGTKLIYFVRHGQGFHNLAAAESKFRCDCREEKSGNCPYLDPALTDPRLTPLGVKQANKLARISKDLRLQPEIVYVSPLCRAIQTGLIGFKHLVEEKSSVTFVAVTGAREQSGLHMCDKRRDLSDIKSEFPQVKFDRIKDEKDTLFTSERESDEDLLERAYTFMVDLKKRPEDVIVVCSHSTWLLAVFQCVLDIDSRDFKQWFRTGEMRATVVQWEQPEDESI